MKPCTLWFRQLKDKDGNPVFKFNHLEDGHAESAKPIPKFESQVGWKGSVWGKEHALLTSNHVVVREVHDRPL